ncbi:MAG: hypothetical protein WKH64_12820 [Chloroflexia bacterium]
MYRARDPRAEVLSRAAEDLADETGEQQALSLAQRSSGWVCRYSLRPSPVAISIPMSSSTRRSSCPR